MELMGKQYRKSAATTAYVVPTLIQVNAPLENLPAEIRRYLLSMLEYGGLRALVHASPVYHQQYLLDRQHLLCECLATILGGDAIDAYAVYRSGLIEFSISRTEEEITRFLEAYQDHRSKLPQYSFLKTLTLDEAISMVTFHCAVIKPLIQHYTYWALGNLTKETKEIQYNGPLSGAEETRLARALYRFQLYCNLFGVSKYRVGCQQLFEFEDADILRIFIGIYEPWEVEEIACAYAFTKEMFDQVFDDIRWSPTLQGAFDFDSALNRRILLEGTLSRGLQLLHNVLFKMKNHAHLVSTMQGQISQSRGASLTQIMSDEPQSIRREQYPSDRDWKETQREPCPFHGDHKELPPLAWTLIWRGTYSNQFGWVVEDDIRLWGYVMWDAARLEHTGAKEVLDRQWEARWRGYDPRNMLF